MLFPHTNGWSPVVPMHAVTQQELGQRIADARRARRWTQGELAGRVGLDQTAMSRIERGPGPSARSSWPSWPRRSMSRSSICSAPGSGRCWRIAASASASAAAP
jgi:DNA-binding XRE family transcriptional regulator